MVDNVEDIETLEDHSKQLSVNSSYMIFIFLLILFIFYNCSFIIFILFYFLKGKNVAYYFKQNIYYCYKIHVYL